MYILQLQVYVCMYMYMCMYVYIYIYIYIYISDDRKEALLVTGTPHSAIYRMHEYESMLRVMLFAYGAACIDVILTNIDISRRVVHCDWQIGCNDVIMPIGNTCR